MGFKDFLERRRMKQEYEAALRAEKKEQELEAKKGERERYEKMAKTYKDYAAEKKRIKEAKRIIKAQTFRGKAEQAGIGLVRNIGRAYVGAGKNVLKNIAGQEKGTGKVIKRKAASRKTFDLIGVRHLQPDKKKKKIRFY